MKNPKCMLVSLICLTALTAACTKSGPENKANASPESKPAQQTSTPLVSRDQALNATPLGLEIGYANKAGFDKMFAGKVQFGKKHPPLYPVMMSTRSILQA
jgi:hypothetical protein